ncbi:MAG TPA: hypothetical protein VMT10_14345 [Solirubrobacteraceae bacterium]|nr:hypothetical protein [Solirubrobacteraceae bacterium]
MKRLRPSSAAAVLAAVLLAAVLAAALLVAVPAAQGRVVTWKRIESPSRLISCIALKYEGPGIECSAPYLPRKYELDPYYELRPHGRTRAGERGDYPGYSVPNRILHYGDVWKRPGIRCSMARSGLTCHNLDGHGFHMARGALRRF